VAAPARLAWGPLAPPPEPGPRANRPELARRAALVVSILGPVVPADPSVFGGGRVGLEVAFDDAWEWSAGVGGVVRGARGVDPLGHIDLLLAGLSVWIAWMARVANVALGAALEARVSLAYAWATAVSDSIGATDQLGLTADLALLARARWCFSPTAALGIDAGLGVAPRGFEARAARTRRVIGWGALFVPLRLTVRVAF
jgi:hypothetical protein